MNKQILESLVDMRVAEAKTLFDAGHFQGSYYLIGYAVECALKVCIAKKVMQHDFPNKDLATKAHTHNLSDLLNVAELKQKLAQKSARESAFGISWAQVKDWNSETRYDSSVTQVKAADMIEAVTHHQNGVLPWLKTFW